MTGAAQSTFDAVLWVLRSYGVARLADDWMLPRLGGFSDDQMHELIAAMHRLIANGAIHVKQVRINNRMTSVLRETP